MTVPSTGSVVSSRPDPTSPIISVSDLRKRYGSLTAVDGVSFDVAEGEVFGILGPNGAGKTTTLEMIEGMRPIDEGSATIDGIDVKSRPREVKRRIGIQLQASAFFDELTLVELLDLFGHLYGRDVEPMTLLGLVDLTEKAKSQGAHAVGRAEAAASASHRRSSTTRACCSSTSRRPGSTRRHGVTCGASSGASATRAARWS